MDIMSDEVTLVWNVAMHYTNPDDDSQYIDEAKGGRIKRCQQDVIKELQVIVNNVGAIVTAYRGQGYVLNVEQESSTRWLIRCGPMTASITIDGWIDAPVLVEIEQLIMEMVNNE